MNMDQESVLLKSELKKFAQQVILDKADEFDKASRFPVENIERLADMGILASLIPETYDGAGLNLTAFVAALEELSKVCASTAMIVAIHNAFFVYPIAKYGSEDMKKKYLPAAATGEIIGGYACVETNEATIVKTEADYLAKGKNPVVFNAASNGPFTAFLPTEKNGSLCACVIERDPAILDNNTDAVLGLKSAGIRQIVFNDHILPAAAIIDKCENGCMIFEHTRDLAIICLAAILIGIAQSALDEAVKYAKDRKQFNRPIIDFAMVREKIALMATNIEISRHLVYDAAGLYDAAKRLQPAASMAKYFAGQTAIEATNQAIQIFGGYGYMKDYPIERYFRNAHVINVVGGTPAAHKELIAKETIG